MKKAHVMDKINLWFKVGISAGVSFTKREQEIVDLVAAVETVQDTIEVVKKIAEFLNEKQANPTPKDEPELPEFNDEFVQALGPFKNTEDFKQKLKENIKLEKERTSGNVDISKDSSKAKILVIPTNEELVIARDTFELAGK
jgi:hypothetical protein